MCWKCFFPGFPIGNLFIFGLFGVMGHEMGQGMVIPSGLQFGLFTFFHLNDRVELFGKRGDGALCGNRQENLPFVSLKVACPHVCSISGQFVSASLDFIW